MDKHVLHNIIHRDSNNNSADCPVCNGSLPLSDTKELSAKANEILKRKQSSGMSYSEEEKQLLEFNEKQENKDDGAGDSGKKSDAYELHTMVDAMQFSEGKRTPPTSFKVLPFGEFTTKYGKITLNKDNAKEMIQHYNDAVRAGGSKTGIPIDLEHGDTMYKGAAGGWMKKFGVRDDGMYCEESEWTPLGRKALEDGVYKFISPEFYLKNYTDPETGKKYNNVITGAGLVNKPAFAHSLDRLVNSEGDKNKNLTETENTFTIYVEPIKSSEKIMDLHEIVKKTLGERTSDEQKFLVDHKDELTFAEAKREGLAEEKTTKKEESTVTGKVAMSESEVKQLQSDAKAGKEAAEKLRKMEMKEEVRKLVFTENGLKLPTDQIEKSVDLLMTMSEEQQTIYKEQLKALPDKVVFKETGHAEDTAVDPSNAGIRFDEMVRAKIKEDKDLSYDKASKIVSAENPDLTKMLIGREN